MAPNMITPSLEADMPRALDDQYDSPTEVSSSSASSDGLAETNASERCPPEFASKAKLQDVELGQTKEESEPDATTTAATRRRRCTCASICFLLLLAVIFVVSIYFVVILDGDVNNFQVPEAWNTIFDQDPFDSVDPEDAIRWRNRGQGVSLSVINALDDHWYPYFEKSISDWDNGYPDALDLTVAQVRQPNPECIPEQGYVKVCNGNYGETSWKGRAEILSDALSGTIIAASARLNEYYLSDRNTAEMQYAMCHELGHAWGVHHTDESFTNRDLGNCMDYTTRHSNNLTPDFSNYVFLHALYGLIPGSKPYNAPTPAPTNAPTPRFVSGTSNSGNQPNNQGPSTGGGSPTNNDANPDPQDDEDDKKGKDDKKNKDKRYRWLDEDSFPPSLVGSNANFPDELLEAIRESRRKEDHSDGSFHVPLAGGFVLHVHHLQA